MGPYKASQDHVEHERVQFGDEGSLYDLTGPCRPNGADSGHDRALVMSEEAYACPKRGSCKMREAPIGPEMYSPQQLLPSSFSRFFRLSIDCPCAIRKSVKKCWGLYLA